MNTILLADDHKIMRQGLYCMIQKQPDMKVIGDAENGQIAVQLARELNPDIVVMDVDMPDLDGIEATRRIKAQNPNIKVLALSTYSKKRYVVDMLRAGASGYLLKERAFRELVHAVHAVQEGKTYLCSRITEVVIDEFTSALTSSIPAIGDSLTEPEYRIFQLLADGKSSKEVALHIGKSSKTVDAARRHIMKKFKFANMADLIKFAVREGLTSLD